MTTLHFSTVIDATPEVVWNTLIAPDTYRLWTAVFSKSSYFEGSWDEGSRIRFLDGEGSGMVGTIAENRPYEFLSIRQAGIVQGGVDDTTSDEARKWTGIENYSFSAVGGVTRLEVAVDVPPEVEDELGRDYPRALAVLKALCETVD